MTPTGARSSRREFPVRRAVHRLVLRAGLAGRRTTGHIVLCQLYWATFALTGMRAGLAGGGARKVTLIPVGANADRY
jgi:hypothetical protein